MINEWDRVDGLAAKLAELFGPAPKVMFILGSGLAPVVERLDGVDSVAAARLPEWPASTVEGHSGKLLKGTLGATEVFVQQGRIHLYEGYSAAEVVRPLRAALTWGVETVVLTNAAGSLDLSLHTGQLMVIEDHLNLTGHNPLVGPNDDRRGPRFPSLNALYDQHLAAQIRFQAAEAGVVVGTGVYAGLLGPNYETPAEVKMLAALGAHAVGMSTVLEAVAAGHLGARLAAISCITNFAAGLSQTPPSHDEVQQVGAAVAADIAQVLEAAMPVLGEQ